MAKFLSDTFAMSMMDDHEADTDAFHPLSATSGVNLPHHIQSSVAAALLDGMDDDQVCSDPDEEKHRQSIRLAKGLAAHNMKPLPDTYVLGENDVICGRGRRCFNHIGNQRFRRMVEDSLSKYAEAGAKLEKTFIICEVVNWVRKNSPNGGFVKKDPVNGRFFEVGDFLAREKTSQAFRDALHDQYKSSNAAKKKRRISEQAIKLHKQSSAPLLSTSAIQGSSDDIEAQREQFQRQQQQQQQPQSRNFGSSSSSSNMIEYTINNNNNPGWMRVDQDRMSFAMMEPNEQNMDLLLGGLDLNSSAHSQRGSNADKRRTFASQKSATSVVENVQLSSQPPWINRSCPNLTNGQTPPRPAYRPSPLMHDVIQESEEEITGNDIHWRNVHDERHHSTPDLYADLSARPDRVMSNHKPSLLLNRMMKKARSERVLMNTAIGKRFDMFEQPQKGACTTQAPIDHEDLVLSPIGDGSTLDLFDKLQGIEEHFESFVNPLPY
jgi:hypothetical protein